MVYGDAGQQEIETQVKALAINTYQLATGLRSGTQPNIKQGRLQNLGKFANISLRTGVQHSVRTIRDQRSLY